MTVTLWRMSSVRSVNAMEKLEDWLAEKLKKPMGFRYDQEQERLLLPAELPPPMLLSCTPSGSQVGAYLGGTSKVSVFFGSWSASI